MTPALGVLLPTREARVSGRDDPAPLLTLAERAEELGFDSVWAGESPIARPRIDPLPLLAAAAARTKRVTIGTAVLLGALRNPVLGAHALASLDRVAAGRLVVGLGAGFPLPATQAEFDAAGAVFGQRVGRLVETVHIWRWLWREGRDGPYNGRYWRLEPMDLQPKPAQAGGPPLWLAGSSPAALQRVGTLFDGWLPYCPTPQRYGEELGQVAGAARAVGRAPHEVTPAMYATIAIDDDPQRAEQALEQYTQAYYGLPLAGMRQLQAFYGGDAEGCARWLEDYVRAGASHVVLRFATLDDPTAMMERAAAEVAPALAVG